MIDLNIVAVTLTVMTSAALIEILTRRYRRR